MLYLTLRHYEYVISVAKFGSMSAAANALNVSQPALSVAVQAVETHIGKQLFIRKKGAAMRPTGYGTSFLNRAEELVAAALQLENSDIEMRTTLKLGCFADLAPKWLAPSLGKIRADLPHLDVTSFVSNFEELTAQISQGHLDMAITFDLGFDGTFERSFLKSVHPNIFVPPHDKLAHASSVSLSELADRSLILFEEGLSIRHMLALFSKRGIRPKVGHRVGSLEVMRSFAANNEGLGISYSAPTTNQSYDGARVVCIPIEDEDAAEDIVVAYRPDMADVAPIEEVISAIKTLA
jgi:DNA-binding transcriptional LysR family regulator